MVCGGLRWFSRFLTAHGHTDVLSSQILVVVCGGVWWFAVVCGGLWWFVVDCGGLSFSHTAQGVSAGGGVGGGGGNTSSGPVARYPPIITLRLLSSYRLSQTPITKSLKLLSGMCVVCSVRYELQSF